MNDDRATVAKTLTPSPANEALEQLEVFVGVWNTVGKVHAIESEPEGVMSATDTYEWLPGKKFLIHKVDARMNGIASWTLEILRWDEEAGSLTSQSFDDQGGIGLYRCEKKGAKWLIDSDNLRFRGEFSKNGDKLAGTWERRCKAGAWANWLDITLSRVL